MRIFSFITILVLLTLNIILGYKLFLNNKNLSDIGLVLNRKNKEISTFQSNFEWEKANNHLILDKGLEFFDVNGKIISSENLFKKKTIVLRYSESNCEECINSEIDILLKNEEKLKENILLLISCKNKRDLFVFDKELRKRGLDNFKICFLPKNGLNIPLEKLNMPYYFCANSNLAMTNFFIPQKYKPKLSERYLINTSKNFLSNNSDQ